MPPASRGRPAAPRGPPSWRSPRPGRARSGPRRRPAGGVASAPRAGARPGPPPDPGPGGAPASRLERGGLEREPEPRGEARRPQDPQLVLVEPSVRRPDRPDEPAHEVVAAADEVVRLLGDRVPEDAVDREVAPLRV